jgi:uncharacterized membrane protein YjfL (UPF0719 family)
MNSQLFILSLIEIMLSIVITVVILFVSYKILKRLFFSKEDLRGNNMAFTIFTVGFIFSIGMILGEILPSITNVIRLSITANEPIDALTIVQYSGLYLFIGFLATVAINAAVFFLFSVLTKGVNEFKEIQQNNISVAILTIAIMLSITLIVKDSIALMVSSLLPYPEVTNYL